MLQPGRQYSATSSYRYGFNGKENDNEVKGEGNQQDYGMRIYDPRLGRFLSVDPLTKSYPMLTPYQFASNDPVAGIDLDGGEILPVNSSIYLQRYSVGSNTAWNVQIIYENIPPPLRNPSTQSLRYTRGGPVTAHGRDYDPEKDGPIIYQTGRYYNAGPDFFGDEEDLDVTRDHTAVPPPSSSTQGTYSFQPDQPNNRSVGANTAAEGKTRASANSVKQVAGLISNWTNQPVWKASIKEENDRRAFYKATNIVDDYIVRNAIGDKGLTQGAGRADLINFITDGTLPTDQNLSTKENLEYQLRIIYTAIQIIYQKDLSYQKSQDQKISDLINAYKQAGGKLDFENIYKFERPER